MIDTLVISGAGPNGITQIGVLQRYIERGEVNIADIKHCYCVSAGALLATILMFATATEIAEYLIQRPWYKWMKADVEMLATGKGLCDGAKFKETLEPFFNAYDVPIDITFQQYYERFGVDMHIYATDVRTFDSVVFDRVTHPTMGVVVAACMSSALYPIFSPVAYGDSFYMDGGYSDNFPAKACFEDGRDPATTLAISIVCKKEDKPSCIPEGGIEFFFYLTTSMVVRLQKHGTNVDAAKSAKIYIEIPARPVFGGEVWGIFLDADPERKRLLYTEGLNLA
jgi:predicted acylesterase/phospholipase RssA